MFEPRNGVGVLELAGFFDPAVGTTARKAAGTEDRFPAWVCVVEALGR